MPTLVAVQAEMRLEDYRDARSFRSRILELTEEAVGGLDDEPRLLAFPEAIGLPLLFTLDAYETVKGSTRLEGAIRRIVRFRWREILSAAVRHRTFGISALHLTRAKEVYAVYTGAFAEAARLAGATLVAGTAFLPHMDREAAQGLHIAGRAVHNTAFVFSPQGRAIARVSKARLVPGRESRAGLARGSVQSLPVLATPVGPLGVAICLDAFHESVIDHLDGLGCRIVVQPSANHAPWDRPWSHDRRLTEGEAWWRYGLRSQLQGRCNLRYGVNPMLVGEIFDLAPSGRSSIVACATTHPEAKCEGWPGLLAVAPTPDREAIVRARVP